MNTASQAIDPRTRILLEAPIASTLLRLAIPNMLVMLAQAAAGLVETYFIGKLGTDALAGVALVFPVVMLMQMMSAGAMGGGIASSIARALGAGRRADANALSVQIELQADCFAGVWGHHAQRKQLLDEGDVEEGLAAAAAIGDDRLTGGRASPESFTHGTSEQRARWLRQGLSSGDIDRCDTFRAARSEL